MGVPKQRGYRYLDFWNAFLNVLDGVKDPIIIPTFSSKLCECAKYTEPTWAQGAGMGRATDSDFNLTSCAVQEISCLIEVF